MIDQDFEKTIKIIVHSRSIFRKGLWFRYWAIFIFMALTLCSGFGLSSESGNESFEDLVIQLSSRSQEVRDEAAEKIASLEMSTGEILSRLIEDPNAGLFQISQVTEHLYENPAARQDILDLLNSPNTELVEVAVRAIDENGEGSETLCRVLRTKLNSWGTQQLEWPEMSAFGSLDWEVARALSNLCQDESTADAIIKRANAYQGESKWLMLSLINSSWGNKYLTDDMRMNLHFNQAQRFNSFESELWEKLTDAEDINFLKKYRSQALSIGRDILSENDAPAVARILALLDDKESIPLMCKQFIQTNDYYPLEASYKNPLEEGPYVAQHYYEDSIKSLAQKDIVLACYFFQDDLQSLQESVRKSINCWPHPGLYALYRLAPERAIEEICREFKKGAGHRGVVSMAIYENILSVGMNKETVRDLIGDRDMGDENNWTYVVDHAPYPRQKPHIYLTFDANGKVSELSSGWD